MNSINEKFICPYCGEETEGSDEHIIPRSLGGALRSFRVCCQRCNNQLGKQVDGPFVKMFAPLRARMGALNGFGTFSGSYRVGITKTDNKDMIYGGTIRHGKICCPELSKERRCSAEELKLTKENIATIQFDWCDQSFRDGLSKIAVGFALDCGIERAQLKHGIETTITDGDLAVKFNFQIVPFCPLNLFDQYIELKTECHLYHHLILFRQGDDLWCYIDLFNTFQFYVLLTSTYSGKDFEYEHFQYVKPMNHDIPTFRHGRSVKDIYIDAMSYGVEPTLNEDDLDRNIATAISKRSVIVSSDAFFRDRLDEFAADLRNKVFKTGNADMCKLSASFLATSSLRYYFGDDDELRHDRYRQRTLTPTGEELSYPLCDMQMSQLEIRKYTMDKFARLWKHLNTK